MAPAAPTDPPTSVREKGARIVLVFNVANVRANSVQVEARGATTEEPAGSLHVSFSSVSPSRSFEKTLVLPHAVESKTVHDVQSKSLTVQLVKIDGSKEWGQAWLKPKKPKRKDDGKAAGGRTEEVKDEEKARSESLEETKGMVDSVSEREKTEVREDMVEVKKEVEIEAKEREKKAEIEAKEKEKKAEIEAKEKEKKAEAAAKEKEKKAEIEAKEKEKKAEAAAREKEKKAEAAAKEKEKKAEAAAKEKEKKAEIEAKEKEKKAEVKEKEKKPGKEQEKADMKEKKGQEKTKENKGKPEQVEPVKEEIKDDKGKAGVKARGKKPKAQDAAELLERVKEQGELLGHAVAPPTDPEIKELVRNGSNLLLSDPKKAQVLLRLAARKGYPAAYLLLAQHAQRQEDDGLFIDSLCNLFTSSKLEQLPKNLLSTCATQLTAVLRDPKNQKEVEARAHAIESIAKDWPIMNILKLQAPRGEEGAKEKPKQVSAKAPPQGTREAEFQRIKAAMVEAPQGWKEEKDSWCLSVPDLKDISQAKLEISAEDVRLSVERHVIVQIAVPKTLDVSKTEASWMKQSRRLEVRGPKI